MTEIMESAQRSTDDFSKLAKKIHEDFPYKVEKAINQFKPPFWSFMNLFSIVTWGTNTVKEYVSPSVIVNPSPFPALNFYWGVY